MNDQSAVASFIAPTVKSNFRVLFGLTISDGNGNTDSEQFNIIISNNTAVNKKQDHQVNELPASVIKKDQAEKSKTKLLNLSSIDRRPDSKTLPYDNQAQLVKNQVKSPSLGNNKVKVNAGKDIRVASGAITTLHGTILSDLDSKQIKLTWTQKKGPLIQLSSSHVLDPVFIAPNVKGNERIELDLVASDQNGILDSDIMNVVNLTWR